MPLSTTLEALHEAIQMTMGWTFSHLWEFEIDGRSYGDPSFREFDDEPVVYKANGLRLGSREQDPSRPRRSHAAFSLSASAVVVARRSAAQASRSVMR